MKNSNHPLFTRVISRLCKLVILILFPVFSFSQSYITFDSNPDDNNGLGGPTSAVTGPAANAGDLVVMFAHYNANTPAITISNNGGQAWNAATTASGSSQSVAIWWCQFNGTWSGAPTVTVGAGNTLALTNALYVFRPTGPNVQWVIHNAAVNSTNTALTNTITGPATTATNTVTMAFWSLSATTNSWSTPTGTGWAAPHQRIRNTQGTDQSMTAAYRILPATGGTSNVSSTKTAGTGVTALRTTITWAEQRTNNLCASAIPLTSEFTCVPTAGSISSATYIAGGGIPGCGVANPDVWYSFVAKTSNPTIRTARTSGGNGRRTELFSGSCGALTLPQCSGNSNDLVASGLTPGQTYYVRVYAEDGIAFAYNICVIDAAPTNDACASPVTLTHGNTCTYTSGNMFGATLQANPPLAPCTGPATYDLWYSFVAQDNNATVDLANVGSAISGARIQLLTNNCTSGVNNGCGDEASSIVTSSLTIGTTYFIRVYGTGTAPLNALNAGFDVCVTYPTLPPPTNDNCAGTVTLLNNPGCSNLVGTMANATLSGYTITGNCAGGATYDVWYRFTASITNPVITLSGGANNFTNRGIQLLTGTCGTTPTFNSIACNATTINATGLTVGNIYYIRVYSTTAGPAPIGNANFSLCVASATQPLKFGNSYVNITKKTTGGVVEPGDILEIRMTVAHTTGTMYNMRYVDLIPTNTVYDSTSNINIITNEGLVVPTKSYTWAGGDDAAMYTGTPAAGQYNIRMNLVFGGSSTAVANTGTTNTGANGTMAATTDQPKGTTNSMLFATAFRVKVTGAVDSVITLGAGRFIYATSSGGADNILTATPYQIQISTPLSLCANSTGVNMSQESGGTFGSGPTLNRSYDLATPIPSYTFVNISAAQGLGDGQYSIVKNMSPRGGVDSSADRVGNCVAAIPSQQACAMRMHSGHWEVDGDHTGNISYTGNAPTANGAPGGYMLMVNADYVASEVYRQTITGLCPNTYYEFSAWFRNICKSCGNDYTTGGNYAVRQPGVLPNLSFALDGLDRYNTGEIPYDVNGTNNGWVKKGFVFVTGPLQTSATFSIRNNSQGGGGNDWAMDDIAVATCLPNMSYSPSLNPVVCLGNSITLNDTITSYFSNYVNYKWQRSATGGGAWTDIPGESGTATATPVTGGYRYITSYAVPLADAQLANNGDRYRVIVATTTDNLSDEDCNVTDGISIIDVNVMDCTPILKTELLSFNARLVDNKGLLTWTTSLEEGKVVYRIERSADGSRFEQVGTINGYNNQASLNRYSFTDPVVVNDKAWYRIVMISADGGKKYTSVILLKNGTPDFDLVRVVNPFRNKLEFDISVSSNSLLDISLVDMLGNTVRTAKQMVYPGTNSLNLLNTESLAAGVYTLRIIRNEKVIIKRVVKTN